MSEGSTTQKARGRGIGILTRFIMHDAVPNAESGGERLVKIAEPHFINQTGCQTRTHRAKSEGVAS